MFFDNSLLKDHTGYILAIIVVFLQSAHLEKDEAVGFSVVVIERNCDQYLPSDQATNPTVPELPE